ncbi:hypothetical protein LJC29_07090 [Bacteroides sp. OttesenSCG-928-N06]|nr:hypothetical protein [Bacteroides sp. OttesenSCG-928-N06]
MRKLVNTIFYIGFLFFGGGFLIAFGQFVLYNGVGDLFSYVKAENAEINYETYLSNKFEITDIIYTYEANNKSYSSRESIATLAIEREGIQINKVYYNKTFPTLSYIGNNGLSLRKAQTGMVVMGSFCLFLFSIYKFADIDKWIGVYTRGEYKSSKKR